MIRGAVLLVALSACGGETVLLVEVDLTHYTVPAEVDLLHLELDANDGELLGKSFPLAPGDTEPVFELLPAKRTPASFALIAYAYLGTTLVSQSESVDVTIDDGEEATVGLMVP